MQGILACNNNMCNRWGYTCDYCCMPSSTVLLHGCFLVSTPFGTTSYILNILNEKYFYTCFTGVFLLCKPAHTSITLFFSISCTLEPHLSMKCGMHMHKEKMASNNKEVIDLVQVKLQRLSWSRITHARERSRFM